MLNKPPPTPRPVSIELDGRHYTGNYVVERGLITVRALGLTEATPVGRMSSEDQARRMVAEIVRKRTPTQAWGVA
jgi:hypothetical protein